MNRYSNAMLTLLAKPAVVYRKDGTRRNFPDGDLGEADLDHPYGEFLVSYRSTTPVAESTAAHPLTRLG